MFGVRHFSKRGPNQYDQEAAKRDDLSNVALFQCKLILLNGIFYRLGFKIALSLYSFFFPKKHDDYIVGLLYLLNLTHPIKHPPFASALFFELRASENTNAKFVRILYKSNGHNEPISINELKLPDCADVMCPLVDFFRLTENRTVQNFLDECKTPRNGKLE